MINENKQTEILTKKEFGEKDISDLDEIFYNLISSRIPETEKFNDWYQVEYRINNQFFDFEVKAEKMLNKTINNYLYFFYAKKSKNKTWIRIYEMIPELYEIYVILSSL